MLNFSKISILLMTLIFLNGCLNSSCNRYNVINSDSYNHLSQIDNKELEEFFLQVALELYPNKYDIDSIEKVIISDFANMHTLRIGRSGRLLSEYLKNSINRYRGKSIVKIDISNQLEFNSDGLHILSRDINSVKILNLKAQEFIVNSYDYNGNKLTLFIKRVNAKDSKVIKSIIKTIEFECNSNNIRSFILN